jgi:hypothetical protein
LGLDGAVPDHSTFSKNRHGRFRDSDVLRKLFETVVARCMREGLAGGEAFAVDASMIAADAHRRRGVAKVEDLNPTSNRAVAEYLAVHFPASKTAPDLNRCRRLGGFFNTIRRKRTGGVRQSRRRSGRSLLRGAVTAIRRVVWTPIGEPGLRRCRTEWGQDATPHHGAATEANLAARWRRRRRARLSLVCPPTRTNLQHHALTKP